LRTSLLLINAAPPHATNNNQPLDNLPTTHH
jgi:hypothetical protein